jgi:hypothetical protein
MVDTDGDSPGDRSTVDQPGNAIGTHPASLRGHSRVRRSVPVVALTVLLATVAAGVLGQPGAAHSALTSHPSAPPTPSTGVIDPQRLAVTATTTPIPSPAGDPATSPTATPVQHAVDPTPTPAPVAPSPAVALPMTATVPTPSSIPAATGPSIASLVAEVEAAGIDPGPTWTWSMGDPSAMCGAIQGSVGTGCTSGAAGSATTVFAGSPSLGLVAHEIANAETENYAVPALVAEVTSAEAATSWSPIDAVASCLVAHFMGFQDNAAGSWQCPTDLATAVATGIR